MVLSVGNIALLKSGASAMFKYWIIGKIERRGTTLRDKAVAFFTGNLRIIRKSGTITMPPPNPLKETTIPANKPTKSRARVEVF